MKSMSSLIIFALIAGMLGGLMGSWVLKKINRPSDQERIAEFYRTETAVMVSPHHLRKQIAKGYLNAILVDVRSQEEYEREHVVGAVNIPAYKDANTSAYGDVERIVNSFRELGTEKEVIVYCYSMEDRKNPG
jgi:rhodanese-related sulfurtransferase